MQCVDQVYLKFLTYYKIERLNECSNLGFLKF